MSKLKEEILKEAEKQIADILKKFCYEKYGKIYLGEKITEGSVRIEGLTLSFNDFISWLSSKLDEIEKEVMGLLPEEKAMSFVNCRKHNLSDYSKDCPDCYWEVDEIEAREFNSAIQTIRERLTKYFL